MAVHEVFEDPDMGREMKGSCAAKFSVGAGTRRLRFLHYKRGGYRREAPKR